MFSIKHAESPCVSEEVTNFLAMAKWSWIKGLKLDFEAIIFSLIGGMNWIRADESLQEPAGMLLQLCIGICRCTFLGPDMQKG